jgi:hypothetical protein
MPNWYDGQGFLEERQAEDVTRAKEHILSRNKTITPERVISNLTFGFWVTILSKNYNDRFWRSNGAENLKRAFPYALGRERKRSVIMNKFYAVNNLRNLAFHYEPIFDLQSLLDDHRRAYDGIGWIDPGMVPTIRTFDRFPDTHSHGKERIRTAIRQHLGIPAPKTKVVPTVSTSSLRRRKMRPV